MSKKQLVVVICLAILLVLALAVFAVVRKVGQEDIAASEASQLENVDTKMERGMAFISYPSEGVSIAIPGRWTSRYYPKLGEGVYASYNHSIGTFAYAELYFEASKTRFDIETFKQEKPGYNINLTEEGGGRIKYYGSLDDNEHYDGFGSIPDAEYYLDASRNNYVVGRTIEHAGGVIYLECLTKGPQYAELISDCNNIVESLSIK